MHDSRADQMCVTCGNVYDKAFRIEMGDQHFVFDCFECAIHQLAPACATCGIRILGHGTEADGLMYCCAHCARSAGAREAKDRVDSAAR